jgi:hypothetical protein
MDSLIIIVELCTEVLFIAIHTELNLGIEDYAINSIIEFY